MRKSTGLPRRQRIVDGTSFEAVFRDKVSVHGRYFSVHAAHNRTGCARLGLVVSRKVSKKAVQRNRIKRQIRETFRLGQGELPDMDYVVVARPGGSDQDNSVLKQELTRLLEISRAKCQNRG
ncbi:MAG: ribonuclease P protein component [Gammaproteobacteria bacterium]|nr:ribonuclease P protein component [Gammaproteobacteria bacterium]MYD76349.1 ribonuclease P protein component [Gammaproteobacteria bacterium]MYJ51191.1 ribonuclease P protein component [Gammaproteobacteria bacterium]